MSYVKLKGHRILLDGEFVQKGKESPSFTLVNQNLQDCHLNEFIGEKKILYIVPSLDTEVCLKSTKILNQLASEHKDSIILIISADLPFAQKRVCGVEKMANIVTLSMMRNKDFARDYGVLIKEGPLTGLCARALIVLDANNKILYTELVEEIAQEPDYENATKAFKN